ncbi:MAG: hypothetical protein KDH84_18665, partial [Calditrichaeota bacterium]|nr:hypothetical protein [Calditrichota bacterium]MCB0315252.1 hypothetical protein [Calditrichota bacterium]
LSSRRGSTSRSKSWPLTVTFTEKSGAFSMTSISGKKLLKVYHIDFLGGRQGDFWEKKRRAEGRGQRAEGRGRTELLRLINTIIFCAFQPVSTSWGYQHAFALCPPPSAKIGHFSR